MASAAPTYESTKETANYARLCRLLVDVGSDALRNKFDSIHPPARLHGVLTNAPVLNTLRQLKNRRILSPTHWSKLYPLHSSSASSKDFDFILLMLLLRSICGLHPPVSGWDNLPPPSDTSDEANKVRLKHYRNHIYAHATQASMDDPTFNHCWQDISNALIGLGVDAAAINKLKTEGMDPVVETHLKELLKEKEDRVKELEKKLKSAKTTSELGSLTDPNEANQDKKTLSVRFDSFPPEVAHSVIRAEDLPAKTTLLDNRRLPVDILLLTVEECELISCASYLNPGFCRTSHRDLGYVYLGDIGHDEMKLNIALMQCQGRFNVVGGSSVVVLDAVKVLRPKAVFCVGSCSGLDPGKAKLGDVVVAEKLIKLRSRVFTEDSFEGVPLKSYVSKVMLTAYRGWKPPLKEALDIKVYRGAFLSGPEIISSFERCKDLIARFPEAVAIESEGEGVHAALHHLGIDYIVIKGISDVPDGRKRGRYSWRLFASLMAASLTAHILSDAIVFQDWPHYGSTTPAEILARGKRATEAYNRALLEGDGHARRVPVMIIGHARSGKTSLKKSLKGQLFNPDERSTVGIETDPSYFKISTDIWRTSMNSEDTEPEQTLSFEHQTALQVVKSISNADKFSRNPSDSVKEPSNERSDELRSITTELSPQDSKPVEKGKADLEFSEYPKTKGVNQSLEDPQDLLLVPEDVAALVQRLLESNTEVKDKSDLYAILWDFGGQSVYYETHPIFLTKKAIYFLACNLSCDPCKKVNPPTKKGIYGTLQDTCYSKTTLDHLDFWMSSIYSLVGPNISGQEFPLSEPVPPVSLVCTHADKPYGRVNPDELASKIYGALKDKVYGKLLKGFFVVDNTKSGSDDECQGVKELRKEVISVSKDFPQINEAIPLKWLKYEKVLQCLSKEGCNWIPITKAKEIASGECGIDDVEQFQTLLNFLHDLRVLIHFNENESPELKSMVILSPQWLIDVFKEVITVKSSKQMDKNVEELWHNLERKGVLDERLLYHAWRQLFDDQETCKSLIAIMERFSLLCSWPSNGTTKQYLVPSMLLSPPTEDVLKHLNCVRTPSLFVAFNSGRVSPGLFPRLVLLFYQWSKTEWKSDIDPELRKNFVMFHILPHLAISVIFILHSSSIEIIFHDGNEGASVRCQSALFTSRAIHSQLRCLLEGIRKKFFWLKHMRYEMCVCCPVCSHKDGVKCCAHNIRGCECLHFLSESYLRNRPYCDKPGIYLDRTISVTMFEHWFALSDAHESRIPFIQQGETEPDNTEKCCVSSNEETLSVQFVPDPPDVVVTQVMNKDLPAKTTLWDDRRLPIDILLLMVEDYEFLSCISYLNSGFCKTYDTDLGYVYLGDIGHDKMKLNIALMKCRGGSNTVGGSTVVVLNAVKVLRPKAVFCVGSCSGLDYEKVKLGDVVVSEKLITYGPHKVTESDFKPLGDIVPLKPHLLKLMLTADHGWKPPLKNSIALDVSLRRGALLSGPDIINSRKGFNNLITRFPEAVAIEREGAGVYTAAHDLDIDWIVVKGISEYADSTNLKANSWRKFASLMAASLTAHILSDAIVFQDWPHYDSTRVEKFKKSVSRMKRDARLALGRWVGELNINALVAGLVFLVAVVWILYFGYN